MTDAPTNEIAIGRKIRLFATFSPRSDSRSASTATAMPKTTVTDGTSSSHSRLLVIESQNSSDRSPVKIVEKLSSPTYSVLSSLAKA